MFSVIAKVRDHASLFAPAVIAVVTIVQFLLVLRLAGAQQDAAHVLDITGAQRSRTQLIAYDIARAHYGDPQGDWRGRVEATLHNMVVIRRRWMYSPLFPAGPFDSQGRAGLDRDMAAYTSLVRILERDPRSKPAFAGLDLYRRALFARYDAAAQLRVALLDSRASALVRILDITLLVQLLTLALVWARFAIPAARRLGRMLAELTQERSRTRSFFEQNPDAVAVFDANGRLTQANPAWEALAGAATSPALGTHLTELWDAEVLDRAIEAHDAASRGDVVTFEGSLRGRAGGIAVMTTFFPHVVDGQTQGVILVARDVRALKVLREESDVQSRRIFALYDVLSAHGRSWEAQLADTLQLAVSLLGFESGVVSEMDGATMTCLALVGRAGNLFVGMEFPFAGSLSESIVLMDDVWEAGDLLATDFRTSQTHRRSGWRDVVAMRIFADGHVYGTLALANRVPRAVPIPDRDREFVRIVTALLGSIIERGRREKKLDSLAFFDALTGLPNRTIVRERIASLVAESAVTGENFAVYFVDLDKFKTVNDTAGHPAGDEVLRIVARRLQRVVRETDLVARLGGDEFVIVQPGVDRRQDAQALAERVIAAMDVPFRANGRMFRLGCSVGIGFYPVDGADEAELIAGADDAMYRAKASGRPEYAASASRATRSKQLAG